MGKIKKNNRKCIICGKEYSYCPVCGQDAKKPSWYTIFCGENCNAIYETVTAYRDGGCTIEAARDILNSLDLSVVDDDGFNATTKNQINEILGVVVEENKAVDAIKEVVEDKVVDETVIEDKEKVEKPKNDFKQSNNYDKHNNKNFRK